MKTLHPLRQGVLIFLASSPAGSSEHSLIALYALARISKIYSYVLGLVLCADKHSAGLVANRRDPRQRNLFGDEPGQRAFWQARFYDFNVWMKRMDD